MHNFPHRLMFTFFTLQMIIVVEILQFHSHYKTCWTKKDNVYL